jgi:hypothetical protein
MLENRLRAEIDLCGRGLMPAYPIARTYANSGRRGQAMQYLEAALSRHETMILAARTDPMLTVLRDDPSYGAFLMQVDRATGERLR